MNYIQTAQQGNNSWLRYLSGTILVFIAWLVLGTVATVFAALAVVVVRGEINESTFFQLLDSPPPELVIPAFVVLMVSFVPFLLGVLAVVRFLHNRPVRTLVTGQPRINWRRMAFGAGLWAALSIGTTLIDLLLRPGMYSFQFDLALWLPFTLLALLLIPIQSGTEELFFRGYLMQATTLISRNPIILMIPSSLLFGVLHLANPEVVVNFWLVAPYYLLFALFAAWMSLKDGTVELALGMHIANNLTAVLVTFPESALPAPAPIIKNGLEPALDLVLFIVLAAVFYLIAFRGRAFTPIPEIKKLEMETEVSESVVVRQAEFAE